MDKEDAFEDDYNEEEEERKNEEWWNSLSEKEQDEYIKYWEDMDKRIEEESKNRPPRPKVLPFEDIGALEEMMPEEREEWLKQKYAYALELISIADLMDKKGSFEIAN